MVRARTHDVGPPSLTCLASLEKGEPRGADRVLSIAGEALLSQSTGISLSRAARLFSCTTSFPSPPPPAGGGTRLLTRYVCVAALPSASWHRARGGPGRDERAFPLNRTHVVVDFARTLGIVFH